MQVYKGVIGIKKTLTDFYFSEYFTLHSSPTKEGRCTKHCLNQPKEVQEMLKTNTPFKPVHLTFIYIFHTCGVTLVTCTTSR